MKTECERVLGLLATHEEQYEKVARILGLAPSEVSFIANPGLFASRVWTGMMHADGLDAEEISTRLNISLATIHRYLEER